MVELLQKQVFDLLLLSKNRVVMGAGMDMFDHSGQLMFVEHVTNRLTETVEKLIREHSAVIDFEDEIAVRSVGVALSELGKWQVDNREWRPRPKEPLVLAAEQLRSSKESASNSIDHILETLLAHLSQTTHVAPSSVLASPPCGGSVMDLGAIDIRITAMTGKEISLSCHPTNSLLNLKQHLRLMTGTRIRDQRLVTGTNLLNVDRHACTLQELGLTDGSVLSLVMTRYCLVCLGECQCERCHGEGRYTTGCEACGKVRPDCTQCLGPCRCSQCHGIRGHCPQCGQYHPCWGGDTLVLLEDGSVQKVRDCQIGDALRTLRGHRRIAQIWHGDPARPQLDKEVCCVAGVWITARHPVIVGRRWVNPEDIMPTAPWHRRRHMMPDMFSFELEGHDDTIILLGGAGYPLLVSCTLGKDLGPDFQRDVWTRRSTRCAGPCTQCDAVFVPGARFDAGMEPSLRGSFFQAFPQVEWDGAVEIEFDIAERLATEWQLMMRNHAQILRAQCRARAGSDSGSCSGWLRVH